MEYPWLDNTIEHFTHLIARDRFPHALLLSGRQGTGRAALARYLATMLLCAEHTTQRRPCGRCPSCQQMKAGTHPDYLLLQPEQDTSVIKVDQIRAMTDALSLCAHGQGFKVAIVAPAEAMNINAANSLLKTLEEPSDNTVLVLVSERPAQLPATVRSRCQEVRIAVPDQAAALTWLNGQIQDSGEAETCLQLAAGAPLAALQLAADGVIDRRRERLDELVGILEGRNSVFEVAQLWSKDEQMQGIHWLRDWLMDMLRIRMAGQSQAVRSIDLKDVLDRLAGRLDSRALFRQLDRVNRAARAGAGSLNRQLVTEDILLAWAALGSG